MRLTITIFVVCVVASVIQMFGQWYKNIFGSVPAKMTTTLPLTLSAGM